jgi:hypothetical protein
VLWVRELGQGYSGFVGVGDRVWTQTQTLAGQFVVCLEASTGKTLWEHKYDWPFEAAGVYPGPRSTPSHADGRIVFASPAGVVECLDANTGRPLWSVPLKQRFNGQGTGFGFSCSPTLIQGKVLLPVGGRGASLVALRLEDGSIAWQAGDESASYTPAFPIQRNGQWLVVGYLENSLTCHDLETGKLLWSMHLSQGYDEHSAWPIWSEPYLWLSGPFRSGSQLLKFDDDAAKPPSRVRQSPLLSNDIFSSVLIDGSVYGFDLKDVQAKVHRSSRGVFRCVDFLTGESHWESAAPGHCTVLAADGKLILFNDLGDLVLVRATSERYEELARVTVLGGEICWTQPTLFDGRLFVRNQSRAACLDLRIHRALEDPTSGTGDSLSAKSLRVTDIPQTRYRDLAAVLLPVEPEYAFDVPERDAMVRWWWISLALIGASAMIAGLITSVSSYIRRARQRSTTAESLFRGGVFLFGALGTTFLSDWTDEFQFTWPVCVAIAFDLMVVASVDYARTRHRSLRLRSYALGIFFLIIALAYFLICRRLSLVFEWAFLFGYCAALPIHWLLRRYGPRQRFQLAWTTFLTALGYSVAYWSGVAFLWVRY